MKFKTAEKDMRTLRFFFFIKYSVADPDLQIRWGGGGHLPHPRSNAKILDIALAWGLGTKI